MPPSRNASSAGGISASTNPMLGTKVNRNDTTPHRTAYGTPRTSSSIVSATAAAAPRVGPDLDVDHELALPACRSVRRSRGDVARSIRALSRSASSRSTSRSGPPSARPVTAGRDRRQQRAQARQQRGRVDLRAPASTGTPVASPKLSARARSWSASAPCPCRSPRRARSPTRRAAAASDPMTRTKATTVSVSASHGRMPRRRRTTAGAHGR